MICSQIWRSSVTPLVYRSISEANAAYEARDSAQAQMARGPHRRLGKVGRFPRKSRKNIWMNLEEIGKNLETSWDNLKNHMAMDQYLLIPFLGGRTSIYQLFWCELQGYKVLTHCHVEIQSVQQRQFVHHAAACCRMVPRPLWSSKQTKSMLNLRRTGPLGGGKEADWQLR